VTEACQHTAEPFLSHDPGLIVDSFLLSTLYPWPSFWDFWRLIFFIYNTRVQSPFRDVMNIQWINDRSFLVYSVKDDTGEVQERQFGGLRLRSSVEWGNDEGGRAWGRTSQYTFCLTGSIERGPVSVCAQPPVPPSSLIISLGSSLLGEWWSLPDTKLSQI
jgi:hypothetical protein